MADVDLIFSQAPVATPGPVDLIFGATAGPVEDVEITVAASIAGMSLVATAEVVGDAISETTIAVSITGLSLAAEMDYDSNVERPLCGESSLKHEVASPRQNAAFGLHQIASSLPSATDAPHEDAIRLPAGFGASHHDSIRLPSRFSARHQDARRLPSRFSAQHQEGLRDRRLDRRPRHQDGVPVRGTSGGRHQDTYRDRRGTLDLRHQEGATLTKLFGSDFGEAMLVRSTFGPRHQEAWTPRPGRETPPIPPTPEPCYTPSPHLLFASAFGATPHLVFFCENHPPPPPEGTVVVPVQSVYIVLNDVYLKRVVGNVMLPTFQLSLSIDMDSWTWAFSATLPKSALDDVEPVSGQPVEVEASINGNAYRLLVESVARDRSFQSDRIRISGRGKSARLAAPYAPLMTFANSTQRTAQQLMADVLTFNGVPLGWDIDWFLNDWLVPAGAFNVQGAYIDGLNAIAGAAGAYLQPHPTEDRLAVRLRYPSGPWDWPGITPDIVLPSSVAEREATEWKQKPEYNRVFVSGQGQGVLGQVTRTGTAGDLVAPMVTDPLITAPEAARQRGIAVLGDTGRQAHITLSIPVLESTGIIRPGKWLRYEDGALARIGLTRAVSVDFGGSSAKLRQSVLLETHE